MRILYLPLKKEWYNMIESGEKKEEYRDLTLYWIKRLVAYCSPLKKEDAGCVFKDFTHVRFSYGYTKKTMTYKVENITIGEGKPEWGAPTERNVFIIKLGERTEGGEE